MSGANLKSPNLGLQYNTNSGRRYTTDANGLISNVNTADVIDLMQAGCIVMSSNTVDGLQPISVAFSAITNLDGSSLATSASAGKFGLTVTAGTSQNLAGALSKTATKTDDALIDFVLPPSYVSGSNFNVIVNAQLVGTGTAGTKTVAIKAYQVATNGAHGANLASAAQSITAVAADYSFTVTGASLVAGQKVSLQLESIIQETGGANNLNAQINSVRIS